MAITNIDVGAAPNDGQGDPLRTAFQITNSNFDQLNERAQTTPPTTLLGKVGDQAGYYAYDSTYFYYCFANYTGNTNIWAQVTQVANISTNQITSGNSNVIISGAGGNVVVGVNGVANVAVISSTSANMIGNVVAGGFFLGNGSFLTGLPQTYANANVQAYAESGWAGNIIPAANVAYDLGSPSRQFKDLYLSGNSMYLGGLALTSNGTELFINGNSVISADTPISGNIVVLGNIDGNNINVANSLYVSATGYMFDISSTGTASLTTVTADTVSATGDVTGGNILTSGLVSATGNVSGGNAILTGNLFSNTNPTVTYSGGTASLNADTYAQLYWTSNIANIDPVIGNDAYVWAYVNGNGFTVSGNASPGFEWNQANNEVNISGNIVANGNVTASSFSTFGNLSIDDNASAGNSKVKQIGAASSLTVGYEEDPVGGGNVAYVTFNDPFAPGSTIQFWTGNNLATNTWTIEANGDFGGPGNISILEDFSGTNASLTGNVSMDGDLSITGNVISEANFSGNLTVADAVTASNLIASYANINSSEGLDVYAGDIRVTENLGQGGNITANNINTFNLSIAGNIISDANLSGNLTVAADVVAANISASGNVVASYANINTSAGLDVYAGDIRVTADLGTGGNVTANYFIGDGSQLTNLPGGGAGLPLANGTSNINIATANGNVTITSNASSSWTFDTIGSLTLPGNMIINGNINTLGTQTALLQPTDDLPLSFIASGANGTVTSFWAEDFANLMTSNIAAVYTPLQGTQTVRIVTGSNGGNIAIYDFDKDGVFTTANVSATYAYGDTTEANVFVGTTANISGNITGNYILGNGSQLTGLPAPTVAQDIASVGAMSIMLYDGNIKYNNYATVEPSSGNITGGNILTGGLVSATGNITGNYILGNGSQLTSINAVTVDITDTNGLTTVYYPTFVENRANAQIARADVDLTYRTDDNLLTVGNVSVTGNVTGNTAGFAIGYRDIPQVSFTANATIAATDAGKHYYSTLSTANALTIANNTSVSWAVGTAITVVNRGTGNIIITQGSGVSLYLAGNSTPANRTVTTYGMATLLNVAANIWMINGTGVS
jgi:hypothetical protein